MRKFFNTCIEFLEFLHSKKTYLNRNFNLAINKRPSFTVYNHPSAFYPISRLKFSYKIKLRENKIRASSIVISLLNPHNQPSNIEYQFSWSLASLAISQQYKFQNVNEVFLKWIKVINSREFKFIRQLNDDIITIMSDIKLTLI